MGWGAEAALCQPATQPYAGATDNLSQNANPNAETRDVNDALWIGAPMLASGSIRDPFPAELEEVAARYFELFPPTTKA